MKDRGIQFQMERVARKVFWSMVSPVRRAYWFAVRPETRGTKVLIEHEGKFLLVRITYAHKSWTLPGGGVGRHEEWEAAARREAKEEAGIDLGALHLLGEYSTAREYKHDTVRVFYARVPSDFFEVDGFEVEEAGWFNEEALPEKRRSMVDEALDLYRSALQDGVLE